MLDSLSICAIVGLIVASIIVIIVWTIVGIEYKKLLKQRKIDRLIERIRERAEDSGNESDGDTEELSTLIDMGDYDLGDNNNM
uniref:Protein Vpu n=1 Tax=Human immunodeficiency virus type 1 TaxID=11676 RepID=A0A894WM69_HV1|nr:vpu protein [Human immunodeficiency virus 1]QRX74873.1 vpu protein [Human immunodeficiency virus 1]QRX74882.1 vpu protein [Human immunodeficiency virus 1]QRX74891.1 vpu protein [Human immunodeficiency virus 1]QRX74900.1 vpu protein [Human immunodeficiency virus 1]